MIYFNKNHLLFKHYSYSLCQRTVGSMNTFNYYRLFGVNHSFGLNGSQSAYAVCGNGVLDSGEACEDGNTTNGDGCDDTCAIESGWDCTEAVFLELDFYNELIEEGQGANIWSMSINTTRWMGELFNHHF